MKAMDTTRHTLSVRERTGKRCTVGWTSSPGVSPTVHATGFFGITKRESERLSHCSVRRRSR